MINSIPEPRKTRLISILNRMNITDSTDLAESNLIDEYRRITLDDLECKLADIAIRESARTAEAVPGFMALDVLDLTEIPTSDRRAEWLAEYLKQYGEYPTEPRHIAVSEITEINPNADDPGTVALTIRGHSALMVATTESFDRATQIIRDRADVPFLTGILEGLT